MLFDPKLDYRYTSIFACITNPIVALLGSGKTATTLHLTYTQLCYHLALNRPCKLLANIQLFNFGKYQKHIIPSLSSFLELEDKMRSMDKSVRKIILWDEIQNEFDRRKHGEKAHIHKTIFLNFFRKFNTELFYNSVKQTRTEFRLDEMAQYIYYPKFLNHNQCLVLDGVYGNHFQFNPMFYYNKYKTDEDIQTTFDKTSSYIIKKIKIDKTYKSLLYNNTPKSDLKEYISRMYHVSKTEASLIFSLERITDVEQNKKTNKQTEIIINPIER